MIIIEEHNGVNVLRDDLLPGGTKSILMPHLIKDGEEFVYASPVYGGFQIALSAYCKSYNKRATIFCAKRKVKHPNTIKCESLGAQIIEVPYGYLSVVEKKSRDYCEQTGAVKLQFGAKTPESIGVISNRVKKVIEKLGGEPNEIFCAIGSGTLVTSILNATKKCKVIGVQVGAEFHNEDPRLRTIKYHKTFDKESHSIAPFPSMPNYDLKAWEYCLRYKQSDNVLFWNVL